MMKYFFSQKQLPWVLAFLAAVSTGLYFRTYLLRDQGPRPDKLAAILVERELTGQIQKSLETQNLQLSGDDKLKLAREQAQRMIASDAVSYKNAVARATDEIRKSMPQSSGRKYLLEADPYYYFYLTEQIAAHGKIAEKIKGGKYYHPLMHAPYGYWTAVTWHPYVGWAIGSLVRIMSPGTGWMEALCWVPLVLTVFACLCFLFAAKALNLDAFSFLIGAMALLLSPIFIQRSGFGWYDTDPYNYIFPFSILANVLFGLKNPKWTRTCALMSGFLTGLYGLFWTGWPFMLLLLPAALVAAFVIARRIFRFSPAALPQVPRYLAVHILSALVFAVLFLTPRGLFDSVQSGWEILRKFSLSDMDVWPNIFLTVGEARGASVKKLIFLSGNYLTFGTAVFGLLYVGYQALKEKKAAPIFYWLFLVIFSAPLFVLPLQTERFGILFVIPLTIWTALGVRELKRLLEESVDKHASFFRSKYFRILVPGVFILLIFMPLPLLTAHIVSRGVKPIMDDAWFAAMKDLREKTAEDAVVNSWWPPGYFISGLAHRRVIADGGTQHLRESYWIARALISPDERESAGILRMLNHSGNDALLYLKSAGVDLSAAVDLIISVISVSRNEALLRLPQEMPENAKRQFLDFTHGGYSPPSYLLVYDDLIEQNLAVTMIARWNFNKAREMKLHQKGPKSSYVNDFVNMSGDILKYTPAAKLQKKAGEILFFENGLAVNSGEMDAVLNLAQQNIRGRPKSLFYVRDGLLNEKVFADGAINASALLIQEADGSYRAVLADAVLIRSLLFRLYYLKGQGLKLFKPFSSHFDPITGNHVDVYEQQKPSVETATAPAV